MSLRRELGTTGVQPAPAVELTQRALALGLLLATLAAPVLAAITAGSGQVGAKLAAIGAVGFLPSVASQTVSGVLLGEGRLRLWNVIQLLPPVLSLGALGVL